MPIVLLAEANRAARDAHQWLLARHGFQVETADDGLDCLARLRQFVPDMLVLDLELPWGGGDGVLAVMRQEPRLRPARVVLTSAEASPDVPDGLLAPPVVKTLTKPVPPASLLEAAAPASPKLREQPSSGTDRLEVLVVDDEPLVRDVLRTQLQRQGFHVWTAQSGEEALDLCRRQGGCLAVVLLDVKMPGLDGPHTLEGIRALDAQLPICFMTGHAGDYEPADLLRQGARHVFCKPFRMEEIVRVVRNLANEPVPRPPEN